MNKLIMGSIAIILILFGVIFFLNSKLSNQYTEYQNILGKQQTQVVKLKEDSTTLAMSYAKINNDLNDKVKELKGKNTLLKKWFSQNSALEDSLKKYKIRVTTLVLINTQMDIKIKQLLANKVNDSTFIGSYADKWVDLDLRFNYGKNLQSFNVDNLKIENKQTVIIGKMQNGLITGFLENQNPYMTKKQEFSVEVQSGAYTQSHWDKYKFWYGAGAGILTGGAFYIVIQ